jgi:hypothetical protein
VRLFRRPTTWSRTITWCGIKVFVKESIRKEGPVSLVASHELAEMLVDPSDNLWCLGPGGKLYAYEICDAVEQEQFKVDGVTMSDFLYPDYFQTVRTAKALQLDYMKRMKRPVQVLPGGYSVVRHRRRQTTMYGSRLKEQAFKTEDQRSHRSQYR